MKKMVYWLLGGLIAVFSFLTGFLVRQPKMNKLKKQIELLQKDNRMLIKMVNDKKQDYQKLLIQHKSLKALQFRKKFVIKEKMTENLIMQYAIKTYVTMLIDVGHYGKTLGNEELSFFEAFEKVIEGKDISTSDKAKIHNFIIEHYDCEIKQLKECEYDSIMKELQNKSKN